MCGIAGIWSKTYENSRRRHELECAVEALHHRGPDDRGIWMSDAGLALGHTRLSILDLSALGHQPMESPDGRYVITFNGEIYNFREIRDRLIRMGHTFSGSGDTEVILRAYTEWGSQAVDQFIGIFAFAVWDELEQTLELVRDRVGVKPLYFCWNGTSFCFGSELKALRAFHCWNPEIDRHALGDFLRFGYIADDRSIYRNVRKLKPGHRLKIKADQAPVIEPYWSIVDGLAEPLTGTDEEIEALLEETIIDACRYRMVADVPVGVYLSGGVDSSLVTAILAKHHNQTISTFTIGFSESSHDESRWARKIADHCGADHTEHILESREALEIAKGWGDIFDEPFADSSSIPTLLVSRLARRQVKVVLSADGGDELFSGYNAYITVLNRLSMLRRLPNWARHTAASASHAFASLPGRASRRYFQHLHQILRDPTPAGLIDTSMSHWYPGEIKSLLGDYDGPASQTRYPGDAAKQIGLRDFHHYLPGDILTKVDRTTMLASLEGREPLLDHRLAELAFRLPLHLRRGTLGPKHILKSILYRYVPRHMVDRPKRGFSIPKISWLQGDLRELVNDYLSSDRIRAAGLMDWRTVKQLTDDFYGGTTELSERLWILLTFEMWRESWA